MAKFAADDFEAIRRGMAEKGLDGDFGAQLRAQQEKATAIDRDLPPRMDGPDAIVDGHMFDWKAYAMKKAPDWSRTMKGLATTSAVFSSKSAALTPEKLRLAKALMGNHIADAYLYGRSVFVSQDDVRGVSPAAIGASIHGAVAEEPKAPEHRVRLIPQRKDSMGSTASLAPGEAPNSWAVIVQKLDDDEIIFDEDYDSELTAAHVAGALVDVLGAEEDFG